MVAIAPGPWNYGHTLQKLNLCDTQEVDTKQDFKTSPPTTFLIKNTIFSFVVK